MRRGVSTVVISVVLMVIGVFLAIMVYLTLSGALPGIYQRQEAALPKTNIAIINFINNTPSGSSWNVTIKNNGPVSLQVGGADKWQVYVDDKRANIVNIYAGDQPASPSYPIPVGGVIVIKITTSASPTEPHTVKVFGPQATYAFIGWSPKG